MINDETRRKLRQLNLSEAILCLEQQQSESSIISLPFDERMQCLIKTARLRFLQSGIHSIHYEGRGLNWELLDGFFSCQYIGCHQSILLQGSPA